MQMSDSGKPSSVWNNSAEQYQKDDFKLYWELLPEIHSYQTTCMTGNEKSDLISYTINHVKNKVGTHDLSALSVGCNEGNPGPEMTVFQTGMFKRIDVMDIAEGLIKKQEKIARNRGLKDIRYIIQDLNLIALDENTYDLIWGIGTIHHIQNLELFFEQVNNALTDNGVFMMREYVGPNHLQFTDDQLSKINEILSILPPKYKTMPDGIMRDVAIKPDINEVIAVDPSESIRSQDIMSVMNEKLNVTQISHTGGTILHFLLHAIASNFERGEDAAAILKLLILYEKTLIDNGLLPSDYVFCMAGKKNIQNKY